MPFIPEPSRLVPETHIPAAFTMSLHEETRNQTKPFRSLAAFVRGVAAATARGNAYIG
jgi:hypothetical protein